MIRKSVLLDYFNGSMSVENEYTHDELVLIYHIESVGICDVFDRYVHISGNVCDKLQSLISTIKHMHYKYERYKYIYNIILIDPNIINVFQFIIKNTEYDFKQISLFNIYPSTIFNDKFIVFNIDGNFYESDNLLLYSTEYEKFYITVSNYKLYSGHTYIIDTVHGFKYTFYIDPTYIFNGCLILLSQNDVVIDITKHISDNLSADKILKLKFNKPSLFNKIYGHLRL